MTEIEKSLIANGISETDAKKHARIILRLMSENGNGDISRVKTEREIYEIVSAYLGKTRRERAPSEIMSVKNITPPARGDTSLPADGSADGRAAPDGARYKTTKFSAAEEAPDVGATRKMERTVKKQIVKTVLSDGEKKEYRKIVLKNIPTLLAVYFAIGLVPCRVYPHCASYNGSSLRSCICHRRRKRRFPCGLDIRRHKAFQHRSRGDF